MNKRQCAILASTVSAVLLAACGGGDGSSPSSSSGSSGTGSGMSSSATSSSSTSSSSSSSSSSSASTSSAGIGGIYAGTNTVNGVSEQTEFLVLPNGNFSGIGANASNGCQVLDIGTLSLNGTAITGSFEEGMVATGTTAATDCVYSDGSTLGSGSITGTLSPGAGITVTANETTSSGTVLPAATLDLPLSPLYAEPGPLSKLQGTYSGPSGAVLTVDANGMGTLSGATNGCAVTIQFAEVGNGDHDIYTGATTYSGCTGTDATLNGQTVQGAYTLNDTVSPAQLEGVGSVTIGTTTVIAVTIVSKQ